MRSPFGGKVHAIWDKGLEDGEPVVSFRDADRAARYLAHCRALPIDHEDHLDAGHVVLPCDIAGARWHGEGPDPIGEELLGLEEIVAAQEGDV
jgi:hypothetical protein